MGEQFTMGSALFRVYAVIFTVTLVTSQLQMALDVDRDWVLRLCDVITLPVFPWFAYSAWVRA